MSSLPVGPHRIEEMVKSCLELAEKMLEAHGSFFPWGAVIDATGQRRLLSIDPAMTPTTAASGYDRLVQTVRSQFFQNEIIAAAVLAEASVPPELEPDFPDAIRLVVESSSISRLIFRPFRPVPSRVTTRSPFGVEFGELLGINVQRTLFVRE